MEPPGTSQRVDIQNDTRSGQSLSGGADDGESGALHDQGGEDDWLMSGTSICRR
jgi:hypothetical protein